ncbi:MAG TPA: hypothetical protein VI894_02480 [Candidatus Nanoarchaeia archaeon]|nr:hypothetical protein [Candidatus Nanoarchaeia archaeon]
MLKFKKSKKGITLPLEFLITIIIAMLLFVPAINFAKNLFRLSSQGMESYNNLVTKINEIGKLHGKFTDSIPVRLDENTAIIGFGSKAKYAKVLDLKGNYVKFDKPPECSGKNCVCICREVDLLKSKDLSCEKNMVCSAVNYEISTSTTLTQPANSEDKTYFEGGFIILRFKKYTAAPPNYKDALKNNALAFGIGYPTYLLSRTRTIYIQKYTNKAGSDVISVCETQPAGPGICDYSQLKS